MITRGFAISREDHSRSESRCSGNPRNVATRVSWKHRMSFGIHEAKREFSSLVIAFGTMKRAYWHGVTAIVCMWK
jgi:hypothetical protein